MEPSVTARLGWWPLCGHHPSWVRHRGASPVSPWPLVGRLYIRCYSLRNFRHMVRRLSAMQMDPMAPGMSTEAAWWTPPCRCRIIRARRQLNFPLMMCSNFVLGIRGGIDGAGRSLRVGRREEASSPAWRTPMGRSAIHLLLRRQFRRGRTPARSSRPLACLIRCVRRARPHSPRGPRFLPALRCGPRPRSLFRRRVRPPRCLCPQHAPAASHQHAPAASPPRPSRTPSG